MEFELKYTAAQEEFRNEVRFWLAANVPDGITARPRTLEESRTIYRMPKQTTDSASWASRTSHWPTTACDWTCASMNPPALHISRRRFRKSHARELLPFPRPQNGRRVMRPAGAEAF